VLWHRPQFSKNLKTKSTSIYNLLYYRLFTQSNQNHLSIIYIWFIYFKYIIFLYINIHLFMQLFWSYETSSHICYQMIYWCLFLFEMYFFRLTWNFPEEFQLLIKENIVHILLLFQYNSLPLIVVFAFLSKKIKLDSYLFQKRTFCRKETMHHWFRLCVFFLHGDPDNLRNILLYSDHLYHGLLFYLYF